MIPCRNAAATVLRQLDAVVAQSLEDEFEVVVADNGSNDGTAALVRSRALASGVAVEVVDASGRSGVSHARNVGVRRSRGDYVVLCDADDIVMAGWLAAMVKAFDEGADCVGGVAERYSARGAFLGRDAGVYEFLWPGVGWPIGANCGFRRRVFDELGGFDESFVGGGDETDFFWRAHRLGYPTRAVVGARVAYFLRDRRGMLWCSSFGTEDRRFVCMRSSAHPGCLGRQCGMGPGYSVGVHSVSSSVSVSGHGFVLA